MTINDRESNTDAAIAAAAMISAAQHRMTATRGQRARGSHFLLEQMQLEGLVVGGARRQGPYRAPYVVAVCQHSKTLSDAGRELFDVFRNQRAVTNDADRLKKHLTKFGLDFEHASRRA